MKKASKPGDTTRIDLGEAARAAEDGLVAADEARAAGLERLAMLGRARDNVITRVRADVAAKAGKDNQEVKDLDATLARRKALGDGLKVEAEKAAKPAPRTDEQELVVHGFIRDAKLAGTSGVKVSLAGPHGGEKASATTGKDGYFIVRHGVDKGAELGPVLLHVHDPRHPEPLGLDAELGTAAFVHLILDE